MAKSSKYSRAFKKIKATWDRTGKVKGKKHVTWGGSRGAFSAIAKAASKEASGKSKSARKKTTKRKTTKRKPAKRKATKKPSRRAPNRKPAKRKPAKPKTAKRKPAKKAAPRAKRASKTGNKRYVVSGKTRSITPYRAQELRKAGKKVRLAKTQSPKSGRTSRRGKAGIGLLGKLAIGVGVAVVGYGVYRATKRKTA